MTPGRLNGHLKSVSDSGLVTIRFSKNVVIPPYKYDMLKSLGHVKTAVSGKLEPYNYDWNITDISSREIKLQFKFENFNDIGLYSVSFFFNLNLILAKRRI